MPVVDYMTQVELWCTSFKCALDEEDRPVSRLIWGWRNQLRCAELKWKGVDSACKIVYILQGAAGTPFLIANEKRCSVENTFSFSRVQLRNLLNWTRHGAIHLGSCIQTSTICSTSTYFIRIGSRVFIFDRRQWISAGAFNFGMDIQ